MALQFSGLHLSLIQHFSFKTPLFEASVTEPIKTNSRLKLLKAFWEKGSLYSLNIGTFLLFQKQMFEDIFIVAIMGWGFYKFKKFYFFNFLKLLLEQCVFIRVALSFK